MFAGKTSALISEVERMRENGSSVCLVKAKRDARYDKEWVTTHDNKQMQADQVVEKLCEVNTKGLVAVAVEELHFFPDAADAVSNWLR